VYHQQPVAFERQVAIIIAKKVNIAFFVGVGMGNKFKGEPPGNKFIFIGFAHFFPGGNGLFQQTAVFCQLVIYISDKVVGGGFQRIIMGIPAIIVTKLLISSATNRFLALHANLLIFFGH
jgi:hypothetical protein